MVFDQESIHIPSKVGKFGREHTNGTQIHIVSLCYGVSGATKKAERQYIYLNKSKSIREIAVSIKNWYRPQLSFYNCSKYWIN